MRGKGFGKEVIMQRKIWENEQNIKAILLVQLLILDVSFPNPLLEQSLSFPHQFPIISLQK